MFTNTRYNTDKVSLHCGCTYAYSTSLSLKTIHHTLKWFLLSMDAKMVVQIYLL